MGIIVTKHTYKPVPTINYNHTQTKGKGGDGLPILPYKDVVEQHRQVHPTPKKDRYAFAGDVV